MCIEPSADYIIQIVSIGCPLWVTNGHHTLLSAMIETRSLSCGLIGSWIEPDQHARIEAAWIALPIEAQAQRVAVEIANPALGLPGRGRGHRTQLRAPGWR